MLTFSDYWTDQFTAQFSWRKVTISFEGMDTSPFRWCPDRPCGYRPSSVDGPTAGVTAPVLEMQWRSFFGWRQLKVADDRKQSIRAPSKRRIIHPFTRNCDHPSQEWRSWLSDQIFKILAWKKSVARKIDKKTAIDWKLEFEIGTRIDFKIGKKSKIADSFSSENNHCFRIRRSWINSSICYTLTLEHYARTQWPALACRLLWLCRYIPLNSWFTSN